MKNILFVGDHPFATSGNAGMLHAILSKIDSTKFNVSVFALDSPFIDPLPLVSNPIPFSLLIQPHGSDVSGRLMHILNKADLDALVVVGLDIWYFRSILHEIREVCSKREISWAAIFPYDLQYVRDDWVSWINLHDYPCVYSKYGAEVLKDHVKNIRYFRPPLHVDDIWHPLDNRKRRANRKRIFPTVPDDGFLFGFVGQNQFRKDPQGLIKGFSIAKKQNDKLFLFMHTDFKAGIFNLSQYAEDCGLGSGDVLKKPHSGSVYKIKDMPTLYNCFDCLVNCTLQEGLSWTPLEAMLCGVPVIASDSTAHIEIVQGAGILVPCEEPAVVPLETKGGKSFVDAKKCRPEDIAEAMLEVAGSQELRDDMANKGIQRAQDWIANIDDVNGFFDEICSPARRQTIEVMIPQDDVEAVLFAQHSSAGDVFMTTRCFRGIKDRYQLPLHYMTMPQYIDIVTGNPYVEKVIPWNDAVMSKYKIVLNPHGTKIGPGHWGRNSNSLLSDFYWKLIDVDPGPFFIDHVQPERALVKEDGIGEVSDHAWIPDGKPICVLHTTGGDSVFRTYKYMGDIADALKDRYCTIQLGGVDDFPAWAEVDLRGKLSFRESAWVMSKAKIAVTVDSFISHLAGALGVSQVCLFGSGNHNVVRPNQVRGVLICRAIDYTRRCIGLGPCSASKRDCPTPCTGMHDPADILSDINDLLADKNEVVVRVSG